MDPTRHQVICLRLICRFLLLLSLVVAPSPSSRSISPVRPDGTRLSPSRTPSAAAPGHDRLYGALRGDRNRDLDTGGDRRSIARSIRTLA
jgi:hypothetical protein